MDTRRKISLAITGMTGLASAICLSGSWLFISDIMECRASFSWPETTAKIIQSGPVKRGCKSRDEFNPLVVYSYRVGGKDFQSSRFRIIIDSRCRHLEETMAYLRGYPVGGSLKVYVDPNHPDKALVIREKPFIIWYIMVGVLWVLGLVFGIGALGGMVALFIPPDGGKPA
jgi:hypothetical protein